MGNVLLHGAKLTAVVALTLGLTVGCGLADVEESPIDTTVPIEQTEVQPEGPVEFGVRGQFVQAPSFDGNGQAIWLVPLKNQQFTIDGESHERLYLGAVGSPEVAGLTPGGFGDVDGNLVVKNDGEINISFVSIDETVAGLPRDVTGVVNQRPAPGSEEGPEVLHLYLTLDEPFYMNGKLVDGLDLGAAKTSLLTGLQPGDQVTLGARIDAGEHGAEIASIKNLSAYRYPGSEIQPPTFNGQNFLAGGTTDQVLPEVHLPSDHEHRSNVVVVDAEFGIAHIGHRGIAAGSEVIDGTLNVQAILRGGPELSLDADAVKLADGTALTLLYGGGEQDAEAPHAWYLHDADQTMYRVAFELDAESATPTSARVTAAIDLKIPAND